MPRVTSGDGTGSLQSDLDQLTSAPLLGATGSGKHGRCATNCLRLAVGGGLFSCVAAVLTCTGLLWSVRDEVNQLYGLAAQHHTDGGSSNGVAPGQSPGRAGTSSTVHCTVRGDDPCFGVSPTPAPAFPAAEAVDAARSKSEPYNHTGNTPGHTQALPPAIGESELVPPPPSAAALPAAVVKAADLAETGLPNEMRCTQMQDTAVGGNTDPIMVIQNGVSATHCKAECIVKQGAECRGYVLVPPNAPHDASFCKLFGAAVLDREGWCSVSNATNCGDGCVSTVNGDHGKQFCDLYTGYVSGICRDVTPHPPAPPAPPTCTTTGCPRGHFCAFDWQTGQPSCATCSESSLVAFSSPVYPKDWCDPQFFLACPHLDIEGCKPCTKHSDCPLSNETLGQPAEYCAQGHLPSPGPWGNVTCTAQLNYLIDHVPCAASNFVSEAQCKACVRAHEAGGFLEACTAADKSHFCTTPPSHCQPCSDGEDMCDGVGGDCCSASFQHQCTADPYQCKACTKHADCPTEGADNHPEFCTVERKCSSCGNIESVNSTYCGAFDHKCCSEEFLSTCSGVDDPHQCGPPDDQTALNRIAGSFEWKLSWAAAHGCKDVGSVAYVSGGTDDPATGIRTMLQVCPKALMEGAAPLVDSRDGQATAPRRAGECHIPQTPYLGSGGKSCRTAA